MEGAAQRTTAEIQLAETEMYERRWYLASLESDTDPEVIEARLRLATTLAADDLDRKDDPYHQGWLDGAHQALRWVLGDGERIEDASLDT